MLRSPKKGASSSTPDLMGLGSLEDLQTTKGTRKRKQPDDPTIALIESFKNDIMSVLKTMKNNQEEEFKLVRKEISEIKEQNQNLYVALQSKIEVLEKNNLNNQERIEQLEEKIEEMQRQRNNSFVEIKGIPFVPGENLEEICTKICKEVGLLSTQGVIRSVYRGAQFKKRDRSVILELPSAATKFELLKLHKTYNANHRENSLNNETIGLEGNNSKIYISEYLTQNARKLFFAARNYAKSNGFKYCWTKNGRIFLRKSEEKSALLIKKLSDLEPTLASLA